MNPITKTLLVLASVTTLPGICSVPVACASPFTAPAELKTSAEMTALADSSLPLGIGRGDTHSPVARFNFGTILTSQADFVTHRFLLKNQSSAAILVDRLVPSCGCTTAVLQGASGLLPQVIAPGGQFTILVGLDPSQLSAGPVHKSVSIFDATNSQSLAVLEISGTLRSAVLASSPALNFGNVPSGTSLSLPLTFSIDPSWSPVASSMHLVSSNPDLRTTLGQTPSQRGSVLKKTYQVSVSPQAHLGLLGGVVSLIMPASDSGSNAFKVIASIPVLGQVTGGFSASPSCINFGSVPRGTFLSQQVLLTSTFPGALQDLKVFSAYDGIGVRLADPQAVSAMHSSPASRLSQSQVLEVALSPEIKLGTLTTQVIVTAKNGEQLILPVTVTVSAPLSSR